MWNPFKKKNPPIDAGNYDWTFQFVRGGFAPNESLRQDKRYRAIVWLGGFNFKLIWVRKGSEATFLSTFPKDESNEIDPYKILIKFTPEEMEYMKECSHEWAIKYTDFNENLLNGDMVCKKCGKLFETKKVN